MNPFASKSTFLAVCVLALAGAGCSSSSANGGNPADAGAGDATRPEDSAVPLDAAGQQDHAASDAGSAEDGGESDAGEAGVWCAPPSNKTASCGTCIGSSCENAWCTCLEDPENVDDAGASGCIRYVACVETCVATDAGSPTACLQTICAVAPTTTSEQHAGQEFVDCLVQYCAADCVQ
jgi:hypothetical protein